MLITQLLIIVQDSMEPAHEFSQRVNLQLNLLCTKECSVVGPIQATSSSNGRNTVFITFQTTMPDPPPECITPAFDPSGTGTKPLELPVISSSSKQHSAPAALGGDGD